MRQRARGEDEAEVGLRSGQVENGEGERDRRDRVAEDRDRAPGEEEAELALGERAEAPRRVSPRHEVPLSPQPCQRSGCIQTLTRARSRVRNG